MRDIQPWCVSRQLWWGHRIPAWSGPDGAVFVERTEREAREAARAHYGGAETLTQDEDVLDTWFSSALWPFSTLGWPERTAELPRYYPGRCAGHRLRHHLLLGRADDDDGAALHAGCAVSHRLHPRLVRDERGQKMSKSKGNVIDPLELIDTYGADALRFTICSLTGPGRDVKLGPKLVESHRSFVTKLWNAARFCEMNGIRPDPAFDPAGAALPLNRWILDAANAAIAEANAALEAYRMNEYTGRLLPVCVESFCDWFLELAKPLLERGDEAAAEVRRTAAYVLGTILRLLHPAIPFVTEELGTGSVMASRAA